MLAVKLQHWARCLRLYAAAKQPKFCYSPSKNSIHLCIVAQVGEGVRRKTCRFCCSKNFFNSHMRSWETLPTSSFRAALPTRLPSSHRCARWAAVGRMPAKYFSVGSKFLFLRCSKMSFNITTTTTATQITKRAK